jgi:hypothetical protein
MSRKPFTRLEEHSSVLSVNLQEIDRKQKAFLQQTKLFERADFMKAALNEAIDELKSEIAGLNPRLQM